MGAGNRYPSLQLCYSPLHGQSGVDPSNSLTRMFYKLQALTQHLVNVYHVQVTTEARMCIEVTSAFFTLKTFPSVHINFWYIINDGWHHDSWSYKCPLSYLTLPPVLRHLVDFQCF